MRTRVSALQSGSAGSLVDRFVPVEAEQANLDRIAGIVADGVTAARSAGAEGVDLVLSPDLRGSRIAQLLERRLGPVVSGVRSPEPGAQIAARFIATTAGHSPVEPGADVGVAGLGHSSLGIAVGVTGEAPRWIGSRPIGIDRLASRVRFEDPPTPVQLDVARVSCVRSLATLQPPSFDVLLVVSDFEAIISELCGPGASPGEFDAALDWVLGRTSDELSAVTGFDLHLARLLPAAIAVHQALAATFEATVTPVAPDPAAEVALADLTPESRDR